ncbi:unannotated protein [freshwater metagenome]|uniref:Unannotated protein n=1 Tax=freshwater metagenome TaxID=449393 RepID=A0A6J7H4F5_9ZZZZ|nr:hypothetical protein [Actinomycetota bacterium]
MSDEDIITELFVWAHRFDGYERIASSPENLEAVLEPVRNIFITRGLVPDWCGVDLLRGWMFYLARAERFGGTNPKEWIAVERALLKHSAATTEDLPVRGLEPE